MSKDELRMDREVLVRELEEAGAEFQGSSDQCRCPFHDDQNGSAGVYQENGVWRFKCHACYASGDVFDVIARRDGRELRDVLAEHCGRPVKPAIEPGRPGRHKHTTPQVKTSTAAADGRQRPAGKLFKTLAELEAGLPGEITGKHEYKSASDDPVHLVYRIETSDGKDYRQACPCPGGYRLAAPDKPWTPYNLPAVVEADEIVMVEGEKAADALIKHGITATTTAGGAGKSDQTDLTPLQGKMVTIWPDNDPAGIRHAEQLQAVLLELKCKVLRLDPDKLDLPSKGDAVDYIERLQDDQDIAAEIDKVLETAEPVRPSGSLRQHLQQIRSGELQAVPTPFEVLDKIAQPLLPGKVCLLCGKPGSGKSFFTMQCMLHWAENDIPFAGLMLEESRDYHLKRALALLADEPKILDHNILSQGELDIDSLYDSHADRLDRLASYIDTMSTEVPDYNKVLNWAREQAANGKKVLAIDPITAVNKTEDVWTADQKFIGELLRILDEHGAAALIVTHPKKGKTVQSLDDLAGGAAWQRFSQTVLWLQLYDEGKRFLIGPDKTLQNINARLLVAKARDGKSGLSTAYRFGEGSVKFSEIAVITGKAKDKGNAA
ncbi:DNA primase [Anaerohalosphaera lusitana]|uniref:DNA primase n=1 Tax=Anaerohalosphaera lusitana TaxID=1936003 RepID=A0A1U9NQB2_9BACT|nr:AAA family ATPase [Anaerohalosphaera lusitana]AQT70099.1 DNA primase [Anaerohalosphaera lusitana]